MSRPAAHTGRAIGILGSLVLVSWPQAVVAATPTVELVSASTSGVQGDDMAGRYAGPAISGDGLVVAFDSAARNLVPTDSNRAADVFVHDRTTGVTERVSVTSDEGQASGTSTRPALDRTGTHVVFDSDAPDIVAGDVNQALDVFVRDRTAGTTALVSVSSAEVPANGASHSPAISGSGRFVTFVSVASNLVSGDTNGVDDIFVRDLVAGTTERVSVSTAGVQGSSSTTSASIGDDGRWVVFSSFATNLVPDDTNGQFDAFIHDRATGVTELVSVAQSGGSGDGFSTMPVVSNDGGRVAFWSYATNLVASDTNDRPDVFVRDRITGTTERASVGNDGAQSDGNSPEAGVRGFTAEGPDITPDGRFVTFTSSATNLVADDTNRCPLFFEDRPGACPDAFVRDLDAGTTTRVNLAASGTQANDRTTDPAISDDGASVAFWSAAANLAATDTNLCPLFSTFPGNCPDIFVHDVGVSLSDTDLAVTVGDSIDPATVDEVFGYTVRVRNRGPGVATDAVLTQQLSAGARVVAARPSVGRCRTRPEAVVCDLGTIPPGSTATVVIDVRPVVTGSLRSSATVTATTHDPVLRDNRSVELTQVQPAPT